jgi:hypothetical protein
MLVCACSRQSMPCKITDSVPTGLLVWWPWDRSSGECIFFYFFRPLVPGEYIFILFSVFSSTDSKFKPPTECTAPGTLSRAYRSFPVLRSGLTVCVFVCFVTVLGFRNVMICCF